MLVNRLFLALMPIGLAASVSAQARGLSVDPMVSTEHWQLGGHRVFYRLGDSSVTVSKEQVRDGTDGTLKLKYDFQEPRRYYLSVYWTGRPIPGRCESISFWMHGDESGRPIALAIEDAAERWHQRTIGKIDWQGWRQITVPIGDGDGWQARLRRGEERQPLLHPVWLRQIMAMKKADAPPEGEVFFHDLRAETDAQPMDFVEAEVSSDRQANLFYVGDRANFKIALTNRGDREVRGRIRLEAEDFFMGRRLIGERDVSIGAGKSSAVTLESMAERMGSYTAHVTLSVGQRTRRWVKRFAVSRPGQELPFGHDAMFGSCGSVRGFPAKQMDTVFRLNRDVGIRWGRYGFSWQHVQPSPDRFAWDPAETVAGVKGRAIRAVGGSCNLAAPPDDRLNLRDAVTLAFWLRCEKQPGQWQWPLLKYAGAPWRNYGVYLHKDTGVASFTAGFERGPNSPYFGVSSGWSPWEDEQWHHFAATYSAETGVVVMYIDGREVKRQAINGGRLKTDADPVQLGSVLHGALDEAVIYDRALSAAEVERLARKADPDAASLVAWWSFDDATNPGRDRGSDELHAEPSRFYGQQTAERAREHGIKTLGILGFPPKWASSAPEDAARPWVYKPDLDAWARYVEAVTRKMAGLVDHWEIWNEPNIIVFWEPEPNAQDFMDVVKAGYAAAKRGNPKCTVITPGLAGAGRGRHGIKFLDELIRLGLPKHCDAVSIHPYRQSTPEESDLVGDLEHIATMCEQHGGRKQLWVTEWCWTTQIGGGSTERRSALMTGRGIPLTLSTGLMDRIIWFRLADPGIDRFYSEHNYGLCYHDLTPKPSYFAFRTCAQLLKGAEPAQDIEIGGGVWSRQFRRGNEYVVALWHPTGKATVGLDTRTKRVQVVDLMGNERTEKTWNGVLVMEVGEAILFVRGLKAAIVRGDPLVEATAPSAVLRGDRINLPVSVVNPYQNDRTYRLVLSPGFSPALKLAVPVRGRKREEEDLAIAVPADAAPGPRRLPLDVEIGDLKWRQHVELVVTSVGPGENLVGHWPLDEGKGTIARDTSGNGNHGEITGCRWVTGRKGTALAFGGGVAPEVGAGQGGDPNVQDLVVVPHAPSLDLPEEITLVFWLKLTGDTGTWQFPVTKFHSNIERNYGIYIRPSDFAAAFSTSFVSSESPHTDAGSAPNLHDGQWHHLAATYALRAGEVLMFVDGKPAGRRRVEPSLMKTVGEPLRIGAGTRGLIDDVRVYGRALEPAAIEQLAK